MFILKNCIGHIATPFRRIVAFTIFVAALTITTRDPIAAQRAPAATPPRPGWLPREVNLGNNLTAAQRAEAVAKLEQIERIVLQVPELARPAGFEILPIFYGGSLVKGPFGIARPTDVVEYHYTLSFFYPTRKIAGEGCSCFTVEVNFSNPKASTFRDEQGRDVYFEPQRGDPIPLVTQVLGRLVPNQRSSTTILLASGGELPWQTATREDYYKAVIFDADGKNGEKLAGVRKALETTAYQEWMADAPKRQKDREETVKRMANLISAADLEKYKKTMEDTEREVTASLKASEATQRETNKQALTNLYSDKVREELASMTDAQRRMPALIDANLPTGPNATGWRLAERDSPTVWRVLIPNYDFWRAHRSPVEARGIRVSLEGVATGLRPPVNNALVQANKKLDWAALNQLLDVPR